MATYLRRFANVDTLRAIAPKFLRALLKPHENYFTTRGLALPPPHAADGLDYAKLVAVLMSPDSGTPQLLLEALHMIDEMASPEASHVLLQGAKDNNLHIEGDPKPSSADIAVQVYLQAPDLLERTHHEHLLRSRRSFDYFQSKGRRRRSLKLPSDRVLSGLAKSLDDWYEEKKRARASRILVFPRGDGTWFLVRHADVLNRAGAIEAGQSASVVYQPEKHDVLVYDEAVGELRMNTCNAGERDLFRREFGRHLFGNETFFPGVAKYTLKPLQADGESSVACSDVDGMEWARLTEVRLFWGGPHKHVEIRQASDVFAVLQAQGRAIPARARISQARFLVKFADAKTPRSVTIRPSNVAQYTRDNDAAIVEEWLKKRGFIESKGHDEDE